MAAPAYVGDDLPHQRDQLRWFGGMVGNHVADLVARAAAEHASSAKAVGANPVASLLQDETRRIEMDYLNKKSGEERRGHCWGGKRTTCGGQGSAAVVSGPAFFSARSRA